MFFLSTAVNSSCLFQAMEMHRRCEINMKGTNMDIEASAVSGIVTLKYDEEEMTNSSCSQTKEVTIYNGKSPEMFAESFNIAFIYNCTHLQTILYITLVVLNSRLLLQSFEHVTYSIIYFVHCEEKLLSISAARPDERHYIQRP